LIESDFLKIILPHFCLLYCYVEGNSSYLNDAAHLLNVEKLHIFARSFLQLAQMQTRSYKFSSVKLLQIVLLSEFSKGQYLSSSQAAQWSKDMYEKSLRIEEINLVRDNSVSNNSTSSCGTGLNNFESRRGIITMLIYFYIFKSID
jgi:hypothetical protein